MFKKIVLTSILPLSLCIAENVNAASSLTEAQQQQIDTAIKNVQTEFNVPGIAIAIIQNGEVVLQKGYGVRDINTALPVDENTLFAIASNTKAFTSTALNILAEQKKLDLNDRVIDYLPWFQMSDPYITREMRIKDLLTHRSGLGLGAGDLLFWPPTQYSTQEVVERLRYVPLKTSFRQSYAYDNVLYAVAQLVIEKVSGKPYAEFIQTAIFNPVGMKNTRINNTALLSTDPAATGHALYNFKELKTVPAMAWDNNSAAGGIYSSVSDLTRWMQVQLNNGIIGDKDNKNAPRLFNESSQQQMWEIITPISINNPSIPELLPTKPQFSGYGQGWSLSDYRGHKMVWHTGGWPGMVSRLTLLPYQNSGVVVLTNQESGAAFNAITYTVLDILMDAPNTNWVDAYQKAVKKSQANADESWEKHLATQNKQSKPALKLENYAGQYRDAWYGDIMIDYSANGLRLSFSKTPQLTGKLEHWQNDVFIVRWDDRSLNADAFISFALTPDGKIREARMEAVSPLTDFSFDFHDLILIPKN